MAATKTSQNDKNTEQIRRALKEAFESLCCNNLTYRNLSAEIQKPSTRSLWIDTFKKRAEASGEIYNDNNRLLEQIQKLSRTHYSQDILAFNNDIKFTDLEALSKDNITLYYIYLLTQHLYFDPRHAETPFAIESVCRFYQPDIEARMPQSEIALLLHATLMRSQYQIALLGDKDATRDMIESAYKVLEFEDRYDSLSTDFLRHRFMRAYHTLLYVDLISSGDMTPDASIAIWQRYKAFKAKHPQLGLLNDQASPETTAVYLFIENYIPVYSLFYHLQAQDKGHDAWLQHELREYVDHYQVHPKTFQLYAASKWMLGDWDVNQACQELEAFYHSYSDKLNPHPSIAEVAAVIYIVRQMLYVLLESDAPVEVKQLRIQKGIQVAMSQIKNCTNKRSDFELTRITCDLLNDKKLNAYLDSHQRRKFLMSLYRSALVQTYAHSRMVSRLSEEILDAILRYKPELMVGTFGIKTVDEVEAKSYELNDYLTEAAMYHDIGKFTMIQVVRNDYIALSKREYFMLRKHPERGAQFVAQDPERACYRDVILGHHKWYDGTKGYPKTFDNTKSPYRIFIDILSIADCLEAATDNLGRTYTRSKEFSDLFEEMDAQSGTRYNPDIIQLIKKHSNVYRSLSELTRSGWEYNYYEVYLDYFGKR